MATTFQRALVHLLGIEGGYANIASDPGGKTRFGITEAVARAHGYRGGMRSLPLELAERIYAEDYWQVLRCDDIDRIGTNGAAVAIEVFDTGVNCGTYRAGKWLQVCLNELNQRGQRWRDLAVDGQIGPATIATIEKLYRVRGEEGLEVLHKMLNALQGAHYITLGEWAEDFVYGWFKHRVSYA